MVMVSAGHRALCAAAAQWPVVAEALHRGPVCPFVSGTCVLPRSAAKYSNNNNGWEIPVQKKLTSDNIDLRRMNKAQRNSIFQW